MELEEFKKNLKDGNTTVYVFYDLSEENKRNNCDTYKTTIYLITVKLLFPPKYKDYENIFFFMKYMKIAENSQIAYTIDLEEDIITFYKLIYYLSKKKLRVLREYLEKKLVKELDSEFKIIN
jgi:hypothetical protein